MSDVSSRACAMLINGVEAAGVSSSGLTAGLSFPSSDLAKPSKRITWNEWCILLERSAEALGGPAALSAIGSRYVSGNMGILRSLAAGVLRLRPIYLLGSKWYGPSTLLVHSRDARRSARAAPRAVDRHLSGLSRFPRVLPHHEGHTGQDAIAARAPRR